MSIKKNGFIRLLGLLVEDIFVTPISEDLLEMFNRMGYSPSISRISQFRKNKLSFIWNLFFTFFKRCLCGRKGGQDCTSHQFLTSLFGIYYDEHVDFGSILWYEFVESLKISTKDRELSSHRFWSVILESAYREKKIPYNVEEELQLVSLSLTIPSKLPDQNEFSFVGQIPETMLHRVPSDNPILHAYKATLTKTIQDNVGSVAKQSTKHKEKVTSVSSAKPSKKSKKYKKVFEESSQKTLLKCLVKGPKRSTPRFEIIKSSMTRTQILSDKHDDDIVPSSKFPPVSRSLQLDPIPEKPIAEDPIPEESVAVEPITEEPIAEEQRFTIVTDAMKNVEEPVNENVIEEEENEEDFSETLVP